MVCLHHPGISIKHHDDNKLFKEFKNNKINYKIELQSENRVVKVLQSINSKFQ